MKIIGLRDNIQEREKKYTFIIILFIIIIDFIFNTLPYLEETAPQATQLFGFDLLLLSTHLWFDEFFNQQFFSLNLYAY